MPNYNTLNNWTWAKGEGAGDEAVRPAGQFQWKHSHPGLARMAASASSRVHKD